MYLLPLLLSNLYLGRDVPINPFGLSAGTLGKINLARGALDFYYKPWMNLLNRNQQVVSTINDDVFKITINVQQYKPEEITVKVMDNSVVVKGKHEKQKDETNVASHCQQFMLRYLLPNRADVDQITSSISSDGVLTITGPLKPVHENIIQIKQTGQPAISSNSAKQVEKEQVGTGQTEAEFVDAGQIDAKENDMEQTVTKRANAGRAAEVI